LPDTIPKEALVPDPAPRPVDSPRPIRTFPYDPLQPNARSIPPQPLVEMFKAELGTEPHQNPLICPDCRYVYGISSMEGKTCTQRRMAKPCQGTVRRQWADEEIVGALDERFRLGGISVSWELSDPPVPAGFAVCEVHTPSTVLSAIGFTPGVFGTIYPWAGREGPYLVLSHLWLGGNVALVQERPLFLELIRKAVEPVMRRSGLEQAPILVPVALSEAERRHHLLKQWMSESDYRRSFCRDSTPGRSRALLGFKMQIR